MMTAMDYIDAYGGTVQDIEEYELHPLIKIHICPFCGKEVEEEDAYNMGGLYAWSDPVIAHMKCYEEDNEEAV